MVSATPLPELIYQANDPTCKRNKSCLDLGHVFHVLTIHGAGQSKIDFRLSAFQVFVFIYNKI